jgi:hypothetical protein
MISFVSHCELGPIERLDSFHQYAVRVVMAILPKRRTKQKTINVKNVVVIYFSGVKIEENKVKNAHGYTKME